MRRIGRWVLNALTATSLLLCLAVAVLWVRSLYASDLITWTTDTASSTVLRQIGLQIGYGGFQIEDYQLRYKETSLQSVQEWHRTIPRFQVSHPLDTNLPSLTPRLAEEDMLTFKYPYGWPKGPTTPRFSFSNSRFEDRFFLNTWRVLVIPYRGPVIATAILPGLWLIRRILAFTRRGRAGYCRFCSYDLTANVSGVCPECGTAVASVTGA